MSAEEPKEVETKEVEAKEEVKLDLSNPDVVTKYRSAGEIANKAIALVAAACVDGALVSDVCKVGDDFITAETGKLYNKGKGKIEQKGIGFPTCVTPNQLCGHFSPLPFECESEGGVLKAGDLVKLDLGAHIDGYTAMVATSVVVGDEKVTGKKADLLLAVNTAAEAAVRLIKAGANSGKVTEAITKISEDYKVNPLVGVLTHNMDRFVIAGEKVIIAKEDTDNKVAKFDFEPLQVFAVDIVFSTGAGKGVQSEKRTTVFRREPETTYNLKMKASRAVFSDIKTKFASHPFTLAALDAKTAKIGIKECSEHGLVKDFPVITEKEKELVAQVKFTAALLPGGTVRITYAPVDTSNCESEYKVTDEELVTLLSTSAEKKKKKNNKKKKKKADA